MNTKRNLILLTIFKVITYSFNRKKQSDSLQFNSDSNDSTYCRYENVDDNVKIISFTKNKDLLHSETYRDESNKDRTISISDESETDSIQSNSDNSIEKYYDESTDSYVSNNSNFTNGIIGEDILEDYFEHQFSDSFSYEEEKNYGENFV
ncbi:hypothetical protein CWI36_0134p0040 [Hamiltosporidium magnivora]|uniref:Uncharacterized protein n=1 Tax=Hamiltosporidium magnivora TaxID=148818 RepID=A0A4Q9LJV1_9MICR|nr:hypothetical protein CWI36_0134p0040 [Hamiltosporidium magnivora]